MGGKLKRNWQSEFANNLKILNNAYTVEEAVAQIVEENLRIIKPKPPVKLEMVASLCDIMPEFQYETMQQDARLVPHDGRHYIQVNSRLYNRIGRKRFSIAHEIGHKILTLGKAVELKECSGIGHAMEDLEEEWLCDFAAKHILLLTPQYIEPILRKQKLTTYTIQQIMVDFDVSYEAASRAVVEITSEMALVLYCVPNTITRNLYVTRFYASGTCPNLIEHGDSVSLSKVITRSFLTNHGLQEKEIWQINDEEYQVEVTTVPREIYFRGILQKGIIALVTNIVQ